LTLVAELELVPVSVRHENGDNGASGKEMVRGLLLVLAETENVAGEADEDVSVETRVIGV
jgi:hypothetical protein